MAVRTGMWDLINRTRALTNVGPTQYTINSRVYWSNEDIQDALDANATWVVEDTLGWITQNIDGTANYLTAVSRYKNYEAATSGTAQWIVRSSAGTENGTANYTADYRNGRITWSADQGGTIYDLTGYSYDVHAAAVEILEHKLAYVDEWYDFTADNQTFNRSQVIKNIRDNIDRLSKKVGDNLPGSSGAMFVSQFVRSDLA